MLVSEITWGGGKPLNPKLWRAKIGISAAPRRSAAGARGRHTRGGGGGDSRGIKRLRIDSYMKVQGDLESRFYIVLYAPALGVVCFSA